MSNINKFWHENNNLFVRFNSGTTYKYINVPTEHFDGMTAALSKGAYLNRNIRHNYKYELFVLRCKYCGKEADILIADTFCSEECANDAMNEYQEGEY